MSFWSCRYASLSCWSSMCSVSSDNRSMITDCGFVLETFHTVDPYVRRHSMPVWSPTPVKHTLPHIRAITSFMFTWNSFFRSCLSFRCDCVFSLRLSRWECSHCDGRNHSKSVANENQTNFPTPVSFSVNKIHVVVVSYQFLLPGLKFQEISLSISGPSRLQLRRDLDHFAVRRCFGALFKILPKIDNE